MALTSCKIEGRFREVAVDSDDAGTEPDLSPLVGLKIEMRPRVGQNFFKDDDGPMLPKTARLTTDENGDVRPVDHPGADVYVFPTDDPSVTPFGFTYGVTIHTRQGKFLSAFDMLAPSGGLVNLRNVVPVSPSPGYTIDEVAATEARIQALAAQVDEDADRIEEALADFEDTPSLVLLFENGLV